MSRIPNYHYCNIPAVQLSNPHFFYTETTNPSPKLSCFDSVHTSQYIPSTPAPQEVPRTPSHRNAALHTPKTPDSAIKPPSRTVSPNHPAKECAMHYTQLLASPSKTSPGTCHDSQPREPRRLAFINPEPRAFIMSPHVRMMRSHAYIRGQRCGVIREGTCPRARSRPAILGPLAVRGRGSLRGTLFFYSRVKAARA